GRHRPGYLRFRVLHVSLGVGGRRSLPAAWDRPRADSTHAPGGWPGHKLDTARRSEGGELLPAHRYEPAQLVLADRTNANQFLRHGRACPRAICSRRSTGGHALRLTIGSTRAARLEGSSAAITPTTQTMAATP